MTELDTPEYLSFAEAQAYLDVSKSTLERWIARGLVPVYHLPTRRRRFLPSDLDKMLTPVGTE
jgi:excisionase family DNA binding protein